MTNLQYRKSRGTHKPCTATPEQEQKLWRQIQKETLAERQGREQKSQAQKE